jgi:3-oxoacyl-[acyl-carrier-protein] synthase III
LAYLYSDLSPIREYSLDQREENLMRIASIATRIPSLKLSNEDVLSEIDKHNEDLPRRVVERYKRELACLLRKSGAESRYLRNRSEGETAIGLLKAAMADALAQAELDKSEIDLLMFCSVGRGFMEPANAYFCAQAMGMDCNCFDIGDACMSWVRSLEIAHHFLETPRYKNIMVVNAEFTLYEYGHPDIFKIRFPNQIAYMFPAYTIGEAAVATILTKTDEKWTFDFESAPEAASLCYLPLKGYEDFCENADAIGLNGVNGFVSFGSQLFEIAVHRMIRLVREKVPDIQEADIWFPHVAGSDPFRRAAEILNVDPEKFFTTGFPTYGNIISASIPAAMDLALKTHRLTRGQHVLLCPVSAGMCFAVVQFVF